MGICEHGIPVPVKINPNAPKRRYDDRNPPSLMHDLSPHISTSILDAPLVLVRFPITLRLTGALNL